MEGVLEKGAGGPSRPLQERYDSSAGPGDGDTGNPAHNDQACTQGFDRYTPEIVVQRLWFTGR